MDLVQSEDRYSQGSDVLTHRSISGSQKRPPVSDSVWYKMHACTWWMTWQIRIRSDVRVKNVWQICLERTWYRTQRRPRATAANAETNGTVAAYIKDLRNSQRVSEARACRKVESSSERTEQAQTCLAESAKWSVSALAPLPRFLPSNPLFEAAHMHGIFGRCSLHCFLFSCGQVSDEAYDEVPEEQRGLRLGAGQAEVSSSVVKRAVKLTS